jgi:hypothetical protein
VIKRRSLLIDRARPGDADGGPATRRNRLAASELELY